MHTPEATPAPPKSIPDHPIKNRWLIAASAVGIHISIGAVYAYSVYTKPLNAAFGWTYEQVGLAFSLAIIFLGLSAAFLGGFIERRGPRTAARLAAVFYGGGLALTGLSMHTESLFLYYIGYGVLGGIGLGLGYLSPVSTLMKWFPDRRGMATGLAVMGFGFGALLGGPLIGSLIGTVGLPRTFWILAAAYFAIMVTSAQHISPPPKGWVPGAKKTSQASKAHTVVRPNTDLAQQTAKQALRSPRFYVLWLLLFINVTGGIAVLSVASPMAQEIAGLTAVQAATMVGLLGLFNGLGRIGWSSFSDVIGRPTTFVVFFAIQVVAYVALPSLPHPIAFQGVLFLILTCYGGSFATLPAYIGDLFGTKELSVIYGYLLTAWSAAGVAGPMTVAAVRDHTGAFGATLYIFAGLFAVALVVSLWLKADVRRARAITAPPRAQAV